MQSDKFSCIGIFAVFTCDYVVNGEQEIYSFAVSLVNKLLCKVELVVLTQRSSYVIPKALRKV